MSMTDLKKIKLFLLDMDGTIYHEDELIPGALAFFNLLRSQGKLYVFMTNNSSKGKLAYVKKLTSLGINAREDLIASSVNATVQYIKGRKSGAKIYLVGTESLKAELIAEGFQVVPVEYRKDDIDYVLLGFDTELNYKKIEGACFYISRGYDYLATNCDLKCPIRDNKYVPDCGAIAGMIEKATDRMPKFIGKPERSIVDAVVAKFHVPLEQIACVGDRLYTDILVGKNAGCTSICVLTGEATRQEMDEKNIHPDYVFNSIKDIYEALK